MAQHRPDIVVRNSDIRKYYSNNEWRELSAYEKEQTRNVLRNYLVMTSIGFKAPLPFFITNFEAKQNQAEQEQTRQNSSTETKSLPLNQLPSRGRGRPAKRKPGPKPKIVTEVASKIALTLKLKPTSKSVPKQSSKQPSKPSSEPKLLKETGPTRQQPPRLSKSMSGFIIKNAFKV